MADLRFLLTNDLHGQLSQEKLAFLMQLRQSADAYFDTGDAVKSGNLGVPLGQEAVWERLRQANVTVGVPGNRESHVLQQAATAKFDGASHPIVCANWKFRDGRLYLPEARIWEQNGLRIGAFGIMVPMVTERMASAAISAFLWDQPIPTAQRVAARLRPQVDLLIALTHIGLPQDRRLAEACPELDLILGGHSHDALEAPEIANGVPICQAGSHARFVGEGLWRKDEGLTEWRLHPWLPVRK